MEGRDNVRRVLELIGLARRAGRVIAGTEAVRAALRMRRLPLVIVTEDASPTQRRKVLPTVSRQRVPWLTLGTRDALGRALGRAPVSIVAVTNPRLAEAVRAIGRRTGQGDDSGQADGTN